MRVFSFLLLAALAALVPVAPSEARVRIAWPSATTVAPGETVAVRVRADRTVRVALLRMTGSRPTSVVKSRRMRRGRFEAVVPSAGTFLLAVDTRRRRFSRVIESVAPAPPPVCHEDGDGPYDVRITLDRTRARAGEAFTIVMHNAGTRVAGYGADYAFERWNGSAWERAHEPKPFPAWAAGLDCGETRNFEARVFEELTPGRHRVVKTFGFGENPTRATAELEIVP